MDKLVSPFYERIKRYQQEVQEKSKTAQLIGNGRLLLATVVLGATFYGWRLSNYFCYVIAGIGVLAFVILAIRHKHVKEEISRLKGLISINNKYLARISGEWGTFLDKGDDLVSKDHLYAHDLDIVGEKSLFQWINTTKTWYGRMALAEKLLSPPPSIDEIEKRQKAILELGSKLDFMQEMEFLGTKQKKLGQFPAKLLRYSNVKENLLAGTAGEKLIVSAPYFALALVVGGYFLENQIVLLVGLVAMALQYLLTMLFFPKIAESLEVARTIGYELGSYTEMIAAIRKERFASERLKTLQAPFVAGEDSAYDAIRELERIADWAGISMQPIASVICNGIWLWDLKQIIALEKWRNRYGKEIEGWLSKLGEWESYISLSVIGHVTSQHTFPMVMEETQGVVATDIAHPFIPAEKAVCNKVKMQDEIWIITGSNMSGKTTFLRTLGINMVLAYCGAPVVAKEFSCDRRKIATSMRIRDDLKEGISTFYAELTRIKQVLDAGKSPEKTMFLIDEIFRGTNSVDRILGAKSVLKELNKAGVVGAITTHDLELCGLATHPRIFNYHFSDQYEENALVFDYVLKTGYSTATNAKYLMKLVGISLIE